VEGRHLPATTRCHGSCTTLSLRLRYTSRFCASSSLAAGTDGISTPLHYEISGRPPGTPRVLWSAIFTPTHAGRPTGGSVPRDGRRRERRVSSLPPPPRR